MTITKIKHVLYHENMQFIQDTIYYGKQIFILFDGDILFSDDKIKMSVTVNKYCESSCVSSFDSKERISQCGSGIDGNMQHTAQLTQIFNVFFVCANDMPPRRQHQDIYNRTRWQK